MFKLFFTLKRKLGFLLTTFAVILRPVALPIVPKVEFNFQVIKCTLPLLFLKSKKPGRKTSSPERFEDFVPLDRPF